MRIQILNLNILKHNFNQKILTYIQSILSLKKNMSVNGLKEIIALKITATLESSLASLSFASAGTKLSGIIF
jgi:hypothetical protein